MMVKIKNENYIGPLRFMFVVALSGTVLFGCSNSNPVPPTVNPENGGTQTQSVAWDANQLIVDMDTYVLTNNKQFLLLIPLNSSNNADFGNYYTYSFTSDDPFANLPPSGSQFIGGIQYGINTSHPYCPWTNCEDASLQFNSLVGHSPYVHLTVTAQRVGSSVVLGPTTARPYDWYFGQFQNKGPGGGGAPVLEIKEEDEIAQYQGMDDYTCGLPGDNFYATLPNPITDTNPTSPTRNQELCGLGLRIYSGQNGFDGQNGAYNVSVALVGIGPYSGGTDSHLFCKQYFGTGCDNYWNGNNQIGKLQVNNNNCTNSPVFGGTQPIGTIGISKPAMDKLGISVPELNGVDQCPYVLWRFHE